MAVYNRLCRCEFTCVVSRGSLYYIYIFIKETVTTDQPWLQLYNKTNHSLNYQQQTNLTAILNSPLKWWLAWLIIVYMRLERAIIQIRTSKPSQCFTLLVFNVHTTNYGGVFISQQVVVNIFTLGGRYDWVTQWDQDGWLCFCYDHVGRSAKSACRLEPSWLTRFSLNHNYAPSCPSTCHRITFLCLWQWSVSIHSESSTIVKTH